MSAAYDAIVVGSGAAGSAMAAYLAEGGKRVLILEAGPELPNGKLVSSTLYATSGAGRRMAIHAPRRAVPANSSTCATVDTPIMRRTRRVHRSSRPSVRAVRITVAREAR